MMYVYCFAGFWALCFVAVFAFLVLKGMCYLVYRLIKLASN